ncbi:hypothetical protein D3C76_1506970 [compost metagenome]
MTNSRKPAGNPFHAAKYQNSNCTSRGVLRNSETHTATILAPMRPPASRKPRQARVIRLATTIPARVTHSVVRKPERIHCRGWPVSTPCQSRAGITPLPDAAG